MRTDGQTDRRTGRHRDMMKLSAAFRNYANAPKKLGIRKHQAEINTLTVSTMSQSFNILNM